MEAKMSAWFMEASLAVVSTSESSIETTLLTLMQLLYVNLEAYHLTIAGRQAVAAQLS
jgi:hypothetical protein